MRALAVLLLAVLLALGVLAALEHHRGEQALVAAEQAFDAEQWPAAIAAARVAAEAHVPFTDHAAHALDLLEQIHRHAAEARNPDAAELAHTVALQVAESIGDHERAAQLRAVVLEGESAPARPRISGRGPRTPLGMGLGALGVLALVACALVLQRRAPGRWLYGAAAAATLLLVGARLLA